MKYNLNGFSQKKIMEHGLRLKDTFLLRLIIDLHASKRTKKKIFEEEVYTWCKLSFLQEQIPVYGSQQTIRKNISKLCETGFLRKKVFSKKDEGGKYLYITITEKTESMLYENAFGGTGKGLPQGTGKDVPVPTGKNVPDKDYSNNKDSSSNKYKTLYEFYKGFENLVNHTKYRSTYRKAIQKAERQLDLSLEECKMIIERHSKVVELTANSKNSVKKRGLATLFGQKKYKSTKLICEDYLDDGDFFKRFLKGRENHVEQNKKEVDDFYNPYNQIRSD